VAAALVLLACACSGGPGTSAARTSAGAPSTTAAAEQVGGHEGPMPGTCWRVPPATLRHARWFAASPRVPCSRAHDTETVLAYDLDRPTLAAAHDLASSCATEARLYVGSDLAHWVPWNVYMFMPTRAQIARGESWVRCDVAMFADTSFTLPTTRRGSVRHAVIDHPADVWACTDRDVGPGHRGVTAFVDCRKPHLLEATGDLMGLGGPAFYPTTRQLRSHELPCVLSLTARQRAHGVAVKTVWGPPSDIRGNPDHTVSGVCWRYRLDHGLLPPMS
jgi:hypothetical protein